MEYMYLRIQIQKRSIMKNIYYILLIALVLLGTSCKKSDKIEGTALIGNLNGKSDTLFIYGIDRFYDQLDTIFVEEGQFIHKMKVDTTIIARIYSPTYNEQFVFLKPNDQLNITIDDKDSTQLNISGNKMHEEYNAFRDKMITTPDSLQQELVEDYIKQHPFSITSIAILLENLAWKEQPDYDLIDKIINTMAGTLKDRQNIEEISNKLMRANRAQVSRSSLFFNLADTKGKRVDKKDYNNQTVLLYFWTSWDAKSRQLNKDLRDIQKKWKKNKKSFSIVGINLDIDSLARKEAVKTDSITWTTLLDPTGWDSQVADRYGVMTLPTTFLINKYGSIIGRDLPLDSLKNRIEKELK